MAGDSAARRRYPALALWQTLTADGRRPAIDAPLSRAARYEASARDAYALADSSPTPLGHETWTKAGDEDMQRAMAILARARHEERSA
jgi:hypothetical protein